jgi:putative membrane protein
MPAIASAAAVFVSGLPVFLLGEAGPLSALMAQHLLAMNVVAPLIAATRSRSSTPNSVAALSWSSLAQIAVLWLWHAPSLQVSASQSPAWHLAMLAVLTGAGSIFWWAVISMPPNRRWAAVGALLVTGKLACLLGALLIFAPRDLFNLSGLAIALCGAGPSSLGDQQYAGLMMVIACPLSYVLAATIIATQIIFDTTRDRRTARTEWAVQ